MTAEQLVASATIMAPAEAVFAVLVDPTTHAAIDGTGWVRGPIDPATLTHTGQVFRMAMYHENHPDKEYRVANQVEVLDVPTAIGWKPGYESPETGELEFGGWTWRYDMEATGPAQSKVTLTYDWSAVPAPVRE